MDSSIYMYKLSVDNLYENQYCFVTQHDIDSNKIMIANSNTNFGGVLYHSQNDYMHCVFFSGVVKIIAAEKLKMGDLVKSDDSGHAIKCNSIYPHARVIDGADKGYFAKIII